MSLGDAGTAVAASTATLDGAIADLVEVLWALGREDLVSRANAAATRLHRPETIVCITGERGQGKTSLLNGLLGTDACPVGDDLATSTASAVTVVRDGPAGSVPSVVTVVGDGPVGSVPSVVTVVGGGPAGSVPSVVMVVGDGPVGSVPSAVTVVGDGPAPLVPSAITVVRDGDGPFPAVRLRGAARQVGERIDGIEWVDVTVPSAILRQGLVLVDTPGMGGVGAGHAAATLAFLPFADGLIFVSDTAAELAAPEIAFLRRAAELCPAVLFAQTKTDLHPDWGRVVDGNRGHLVRAGVDVALVAVSSLLRREALARRDRDLNVRSRFPELIDVLGSRVVRPARAAAEARSKADIRGIAGLVRSALDDERRLLADPGSATRATADLQRADHHLEHLQGPDAEWSVVLDDRMGALSDRIGRELAVRDRQTQAADEVSRVVVALAQGWADIHAEVAALLQDAHRRLPGVHGRSRDIGDVAELWQIDAPPRGELIEALLGLLELEVTEGIGRLVRDRACETREGFGARLAELQRTCRETARRAEQVATQTPKEARQRMAEIEAADAVLAKVAALAGPPAAVGHPAPTRDRTTEPTRR